LATFPWASCDPLPHLRIHPRQITDLQRQIALQEAPRTTSPSWLYGNVKQIFGEGQSVARDKWMSVYGKTFRLSVFNVHSVSHSFQLSPKSYLLDSIAFYHRRSNNKPRPHTRTNSRSLEMLKLFLNSWERVRGRSVTVWRSRFCRGRKALQAGGFSYALNSSLSSREALYHGTPGHPATHLLTTSSEKLTLTISTESSLRTCAIQVLRSHLQSEGF